MKVEGDFIMTEDLNIEEDLIVKGNIYGKNGASFNIIALNINAWNINALNITALDITARDINARDINALNITACNITARDINAVGITAEYINYYAVCFAYKNINCKSIKGRRVNYKHFVLDGEIKTKENEE